MFSEELYQSAGERAIEIRHHLHKHPEVGQKEFQTMKLICERLTELGIPFQAGVADTGVVGLIEGAEAGPVVALRADIDALPIQEENRELPYCSENAGVMHACGHDAHTAILLGAAEVLTANRDALRGSVKLLFQPAEESVGGAERMIAEGCMENPHVDYALGLHVTNALPVGKIGVKNGMLNAASDMLELKVHGVSCHGACPGDGVDAILIAAAILTNVQSFVSRNVSPNDAAVVSFGTIHGGNVGNQIADYVELRGIIRTLDPETRTYARKRVREICEGTAAALGGRAELIIHPSYRSLFNDKSVTDAVREAAAEVIGRENIHEEEKPGMGVEDFAYFAAAVPGCFFHLGSKRANDRPRPAHSCYFDIDDRCIPLGIRLHVANVLRMLGK